MTALVLVSLGGWAAAGALVLVLRCEISRTREAADRARAAADWAIVQRQRSEAETEHAQEAARHAFAAARSARSAAGTAAIAAGACLRTRDELIDAANDQAAAAQLITEVASGYVAQQSGGYSPWAGQ